MQIETGSWMERLTGNNAALSLFHLLEECLPVAVDTSAGIFFPSAPSLYWSPPWLYCPPSSSPWIQRVHPQCSSSLNYLFSQELSVCMQAAGAACLPWLGCAWQCACSRPSPGSPPSHSRPGKLLASRHGLRDSWGPRLVFPTRKHMQPLNISRETKAEPRTDLTLVKTNPQPTSLALSSSGAKEGYRDPARARD